MSAEAIEQLTKQLAKANSEAKKYRIGYRKAKEELATVKSELDPVKGELESLKSRSAEDPSALKAELESLKAERRREKHNSVLAKVAKELNLQVAESDLAKLLDYQPDGDEPDEAHVKGLVQEAVKSRPYLVAQPQPTKWQAGPGVSRGGSASVGKFVVRKSDVANEEWVQANQKAFTEAVKKNNVEWVD